MLQGLVDLVFRWLGLDRSNQIVEMFHFFVYDTIKVLMLLFVMIGIIGYIRTYVPMSKVKAWVESKNKIVAHLSASMFGALTPFCSCSSIPLFISFVKMRIPLGVSMSFLITAPILNEYLFVLMLGYFGWKIAFMYALSGILIGVIVGLFLDRLELVKYIEPDILKTEEATDTFESLTQKERLLFGLNEALSIVKKLWKWILLGVGIGAFLHGYVPSEAIHSIVGAVGIFAVPIAVILGIPMYGSCAAIVPIAVVLFEKGMPLGTALAFMMAVSALSLPEAIILRRAMNLKLIALFFSIVAIGIMFTGYIFNFISPLLIQ
ncbi:MAG: permease [Candidatus Margulisbacteria bacterium]|nr:permease [Candidatus Margulisiibacteriota bacterium]